MKREKFNENIFVIMFLSIFLLSFYIRQPILVSLASVNIVFLISLFLFIIVNRKYIDYMKVFYISLILLYILFIDLENKNSIGSIIVNIGIYIIPLYMFSIRISSINFKYILKSITKILNIFVFIIFFIGIIDPFINFSIMRFLGQHLTKGLNEWILGNTKVIGYRYTSFLGHALFTKEIFIYFFLFNNTYLKKYGECILNKNIVTLISLVGVLLTGSKSGVILILICILFLQTGFNKIITSISTLIILLISYFLGFFNNVLLRFSSGSLTTSRNESWEKIVSYGLFNFKFLTGYGEQVSSLLSRIVSETYVTAALEYPIRILLLKYGIVCSVMIIGLIFIYPILYFVKKKNYYILFIFIIKVLDINTYNGLIYKPDNMILFLIFTYVLMGVCKNE